MKNNMKKVLDRGRRASWAVLGPLKEATDPLKESKIEAHLFHSTVFPALGYAAETWADPSTTSKILHTTHKEHERCFLKYNRHTQFLAGMRNFDLRNLSHLRDPTEYRYTTLAKYGMGRSHNYKKNTTDELKELSTPRECRRPLGRRWENVFLTKVYQLYLQL
ncbi:unnamed protein product [Angiostrongylus costaricensis]|uniref:Uncharacterized protein n=1 Tax=Angiostrongylus costaricensis TaxID=334426 RepID=A0A0R3PV41_ANGCS|nr:unnamed protein product [Angiostrongylus costaricensis]